MFLSNRMCNCNGYIKLFDLTRISQVPVAIGHVKVLWYSGNQWRCSTITMSVWSGLLVSVHTRLPLPPPLYLHQNRKHLCTTKIHLLLKVELVGFYPSYCSRWSSLHYRSELVAHVCSLLYRFCYIVYALCMYIVGFLYVVILQCQYSHLLVVFLNSRK